jgi:hypothetical protein
MSKFRNPGHLVDDDLELVLDHEYPGNPDIGYVPAYKFENYYAEIGKELLGRGVLEELDLRYPTHDYQRQPMLDGWIQRDKHIRNTREGAREYFYWSYHWIEDGKRKSEHIGNDAKLEQWNQQHGI